MSSGPHPLDPLNADEFQQVTAILRRECEVGGTWRYASIELHEPAKEALAGTDLIPREAHVICWNRESGQTHRAIVSLTDDAVLSWEHVPDVQPILTVDEWHECEDMLLEHPRLIEALARRGIAELDQIVTDIWGFGGALVAEEYRGLRVCWVDLWHRETPEGNAYAHLLQGLHPIVNLNTMELLDLEDVNPGPAPVIRGEYRPEVTGLPQREIAPLEITQPHGVSFNLDGNLLTWQNWQMRVGFNYREGLVLHTVGYKDGDRVRPIAHRMSFAEMVVPYRDSNPDHYRRTAFDIGEWGLGFMTTSLQLGCDCLGEITYLDAVLHDTQGNPYAIPDAICIHEEDNAILWKHVDHELGAEVRRARRLVVSCHVTVANYEYLIYWRFYQDGNIECEVRATGLMVTSSIPDGQERPVHGTIVDNRTYAPFHQHFIVARLDMEVDGRDNTVYASDSEASPIGEDNPHGLGLIVRNTPLRVESEGKQDYDWHTQRSWKIVNDNVRNSHGTPVAYKLVPGACFPALMDPSSPVFKRAEVIGHTLWVTPYERNERWPSGEFPHLSVHDTGLPVWTRHNRSIENTNVVLWYVFGLHHITRPEEWPIMPVDTVAFWLKPFGFFDRNPTLDVAPSPVACHDEEAHHHG
ncbi:MAG: primary-amine oxidase [Longispora sp.]|nr:primary-amine oxidase [Longispora sp. (in: high G+C Gram-positive bacteria)]